MKLKHTIKFIAISSVLFMSLGNSIFAQISVSSADVLNLIGTSGVIELDTTESVTVDVGSSGADQMWDFSSNVIEGSPFEFEYILPEGTPLAAQYPEANMTQKAFFTSGSRSTTMYIYFNVTSSRMSELGGGMYIASPETLYQDMEGGSFTPLPVNYEDEWVVEKSDTNNLGQGILQITKSVTQSKVDGWGKVKIPAGEFDCLRIREDRADTLMSVFMDQAIVIGSSSTISYQWLGKENAMLVSIESQDDESNPNFTDAAGMSRLKSNSEPNAIDLSYSINVPKRFKLDQNYPNPFNPETTISYSLPTTDYVELHVYNNLGQKVANLISGQQSAGEYKVKWQAGEFPSGLYYYELKAGNFRQFKKMILLK